MVNPYVLVMAVDVVVCATQFLATVSGLCQKKARYFVQDRISHRALFAGELREQDFAFWAGVHAKRFREHELFEAAE